LLIWKIQIQRNQKNTSLELPSCPRPAWFPRITRGDPRGPPLTPYYYYYYLGGSKRRYKSFEYSTTTTTTTQLTPTTTRNFINSQPFCDPVAPGRRLKVGFEPISITYHAAAAMLIARFHISLYQSQDRILLWSRATHHSGSCIILCYILPQGRQHIFGPALLTWLPAIVLLPYSYYYTMLSNQQFWRA